MREPASTAENGRRAHGGEGRREETRRANVQRILKAAAQVFSQAGYDGATMTEIAELSGLPKPNVNYYFRDKRVLYRRVLADIQTIWLEPLKLFRSDAEPAEVLEEYIHAKINLARDYPVESRVFANELIHGAPFIGRYLKTEYNRQIQRVWETFNVWTVEGLIDPIDPKHLMIQIWAATQTYADHEPQVTALLGTPHISDQEFEAAAHQLAMIVIRGIGANPRRS